ANPNKTGFSALKVSLGTFIIPYMFVFGPALIMQEPVNEIIIAVISAIIGIFALTSSLQGWNLMKLTIFERIIGIVCALSLLYPDLITTIIGGGIFIIIYFMHYRRYKKSIPNPFENISNTQ